MMKTSFLDLERLDCKYRLHIVQCTTVHCERSNEANSQNIYRYRSGKVKQEMCKTLTTFWEDDSSVIISKCLRHYDVCRIVDNNLEVMCLTRIKLHCRTNCYLSNMSSRLELNTLPSHTKFRVPGVLNLRCHIVLSFPDPLVIGTNDIIICR